MSHATYKSFEELNAGLEHLQAAPADEGVLTLIVRRPDNRIREVVQSAEFDLKAGLIGDNWRQRAGAAADTAEELDRQLTVMNARSIDLISSDKDERPQAGDQLYVDLDLSVDNLPVGSRLEIGSAVIVVTAPPHNGCKAFAARFGNDAVKFVNSPIGKQLRLRGLNARVMQPGTVRTGDRVRKL